MNYRTTPEIELAVANFFNISQHIIVPNISWGLGIHECDLLIVTKSGYATEVEIKVSRYDLKKDQKKWHGHRSNLIKRLFFAIPVPLIDYKEYIPERAGIILVYGPEDSCPYYNTQEWGGPYCKIEKPAQINKMARKLTAEEMIHLGRLASMRIWSLSHALLNNKYDKADYLLNP
jgi:hypothetical protein